MSQRTYLRRLAVVALVAGGLGAVAQPPAASAIVRSATAAPVPAPAARPADGPARSAGFCWNKPILPDWCQFDTARQKPAAAFRVEPQGTPGDCATIDRRIEDLRDWLQNYAWEPGDPGGRRGYLATRRALLRMLLTLEQERNRCRAAAPN